jgi:hypothetical protein
VTRLLSDSLLVQSNKLRGFLSAWTALEIFIKKFSMKEPMPLEDERRKVPALVNWFNSLSNELGLENPAAKAASFEKVKTVREEVFHLGKDMDDSAFPIEETQNLVRAFLERSNRRRVGEGDGCRPCRPKNAANATYLSPLEL